jgi:hypothetical protein
MGAGYKVMASPTHIYIFINLRGNTRPDYYLVPSREVAKLGRSSKAKTGSVWYSFYREDAKKYQERWSIFGGSPSPQSK